MRSVVGWSVLACGLAACMGDAGGLESSEPSRERSKSIPEAVPPAGAIKGAQSVICESQTVQSTGVVPDVMIVLDRSASMKLAGGENRWDPSVRGVEAVTSLFHESMRFGLITFPGTGDAGVSIHDSCRAGTLEVPVELRSAPAIAAALDALDPVGSTPTTSSLRLAHSLLASPDAAPDAVFAPKYVLLVTDGAPNCADGLAPGNDGDRALDEAVDELRAMTQDGIQTFVVGYDTKENLVLSEALDLMAIYGGTGDLTHRAIEDEESLIAAFDEIAASGVACQYRLESALRDPSLAVVRLDGEALEQDAEDGWRRREDNHAITLTGEACRRLRSPGEHQLEVKVECPPVVVF